jgi:hypothetical protein
MIVFEFIDIDILSFMSDKEKKDFDGNEQSFKTDYLINSMG